MRINKVKVLEKMGEIGISTQTELAKKLCITKSQLSVILSNKYTPVKANIVKLCEVLNVDPFEVVEQL